MSGLTELIDTLEAKLARLSAKMEQLRREKQELESEISQSASLAGRQAGEIAELKKQNETLKMANSLLGSDDNKRETKLKINSLIREIDYCITQLAD